MTYTNREKNFNIITAVAGFGIGATSSLALTGVAATTAAGAALGGVVVKLGQLLNQPRVDTLNTTIATHNTTIATLNAQLAAANQLNVQQTAQIAADQQTKATQAAQIAADQKTKATQAAQIAADRQTKATQAAQIHTDAQTIIDLNTDINFLTAQRDTAIAERDAAIDERDAYSRNSEDVNRALQDLLKRVNQIPAMESRHASQEAQILELEQKLSLSEQQVADALLKTKVLNEKYNTQSNELKALKGAFNEYRDWAEGEISSLKSKLQDSQEAFDKVTKLNQLADQKCESLEASINTAHKMHEKAEDSFKTEKSQFEEAYKDLEARESALQVNHDATELRLKALEEQLNIAEAKVNSMQPAFLPAFSTWWSSPAADDASTRKPTAPQLSVVHEVQTGAEEAGTEAEVGTTLPEGYVDALSLFSRPVAASDETEQLAATAEGHNL